MLEQFSVRFHSIFFFALGGGGGSGGGGGGGSSGGSSFSSSGGGGSSVQLPGWVSVIFVLLPITIAIIASVILVRGAAKRRAAMKAKLVVSAAADTIWEEGSLETHGRDTFVQYQKDWSSFNLDSMKTYMTPAYYQHNLLMMGALKVAARQNDVQRVEVTSAVIVTANDAVDNAQDSYTVGLSVSARDILNDTADNTELFSQHVNVVESYKFQRSGDAWLFAGIDQATANPALRNVSLENFAAENGYFYSLDWGHLLLPRRGQLFNSGSFGVSDINNHVIGLYNDIIIQLYTYVPAPSNAAKTYLIAQTSLPKSYGDIVVRRKAGLFQGGIKGLRQMKMEWNDFNSKYDVFASNEELATSFELLNPRFMEQLQALPFDVSIEVVDNVVYLYAAESGVASSEHYSLMLTILKAAFKEMRM